MFKFDEALAYEAQCELDHKAAIKTYNKILGVDFDLDCIAEDKLEAVRDALSEVALFVESDLKTFEEEIGPVYLDDYYYIVDKYLDFLGSVYKNSVIA